MRRFIALFMAIGTAFLAHVPALSAAEFPTRPVRMIVPLPPGGGTDLLARNVAQRVGNLWKQNVVIDNRGGAGGTIGANLTAQAVPDGYTILLTHLAPITVNPSLQKLPYDPLRDLAAITMVATAPNVILVHPSVPATTVKELIAVIKSKKGQFRYGTGGHGTSPHLSAELFNLMAGTDISHVPYKGFGPAVADLIAGRIQIYMASIPAAKPHIDAGKVRAIAVTSLKRSKLMPEVPSIDEAGLTGFESIQWYGVLSPSKVPPELISKIQKDISTVFSTAEAKQQLFSLGYEETLSKPKEFSAFLKADLDKWARVIKAANIKID
jgi:tripartite-type tricarboxylate transporter receptor subunit TctC